jgi:hypothetical protein
MIFKLSFDIHAMLHVSDIYIPLHYFEKKDNDVVTYILFEIYFSSLMITPGLLFKK